MPAAIPNPVSEAKQMYVLGVLERLSKRGLINYKVRVTDEARAMYRRIEARPAEWPTVEEFFIVLVFLAVGTVASIAASLPLGCGRPRLFSWQRRSTAHQIAGASMSGPASARQGNRSRHRRTGR